MESWLPALGLGIVIGLGVAVPLGAIGVLLLETGMTRGWRAAAAGGLGVAFVDLTFAAVAVLAGRVVAGALADHDRAVRLVGALVVLAVAVRGVVGALRDARERAAGAAPVDRAGQLPVPTGVPRPVNAMASAVPAAVPAATAATAPAAARPARTFAQFVLLTGVNPITVVYFAAVASGLGSRLDGSGATAAFVVGIGVASAGWQLSLAAVGAVLGARVPRRVRTGLSLAGYTIVAGFAVALAAG